jgi:hypothetical protein
MFSDSFFLLSHALHVIYISSVSIPRLFAYIGLLYLSSWFSSLGIDLISGSLSPLVLGVIPDARPPFRSSSRDVSIGVVLVHCHTHLPRVGPIVDPSSLSRHTI